MSAGRVTTDGMAKLAGEHGVEECGGYLSAKVMEATDGFRRQWGCIGGEALRMT